MDAIVKRRTLGVAQFLDFVRLNERFHSLLVGLAHSPVLSRAVERIVALPFASPSAFVMAQSAHADAHQILILSQEQHRAILEALSVGASARAENVAREHSNLAKRNLHAAAKRDAPLHKVAGGNLIRLRQAAV
jgi:GntR family transcriptional regulator of vanillate catabolism